MEETCNCNERKTERPAEEKKALIARINRIVGQLGGVKRMVESDRYCEDILVQLAAIDKAVRSLTGMILVRHMHTCIAEDMKAGNMDSLDEIIALFKRFQ